MNNIQNVQNIVEDFIPQIIQNYKVLIFDMDGTLLDSMKVWKYAGRDYLEALGLKAEENLDRLLFSMSMKETAQYLKENYSLNFSIDEIISTVNSKIIEAYEKTVQLKPGVKKALLKFREEGLKLYLATGSDRCLVQACFERLGISELFEEVFTCSELKASKSSPLIYEKALEASGFEKSKALVFEDAIIPVSTAHNAGFDVAVIYDEESDSEKDNLLKIGKWFFDRWI